MELDFSKICRVCLSEGVMMSIFKVNVSKKLMACASVQVWQNDGLPAQICNKCSAKLHISFQFKKQCEKSDAKLRHYISTISQDINEDADTNQMTLNEPPPPTEIDKPIEVPQQLGAIPQPNCVYVECAPLLGLQEEKFDAFIPQQINYNMQPQNHLQLTNYNLQNVQVYNGTYSMPVQTLPNQIMPSVPPPPTQTHHIQTVPILHQTPETIEDDKEKKKKIRCKDAKNETKQCPTCSKTFSTSTKLSRHMKIHSPDMHFKCKVCNKAFSHSGNYKIHLRMHTDERPFRCTVCDKGCRQAQDLEKHMRTHTGERPHKCTLCTRAFSTSSNLIAHIRTHTGERPYVCCVCQKAFCQSNELTKHMRTHTGEKSHICDICHKGFNGSSTLIVHRRSHTGERPYVCSVCNKGFAQSNCLAVHMKRHNGQKNFHCTICDLTFLTSADLKDHMLSHSPDKTYDCPSCDKKFTRINDLIKHNRCHVNFKVDES